MPGLPSLRIFLVENHRDTLKWLTIHLEEMGHTVGSARNMTEALTELPQGKWQVLISDIGLPDGDGWELLRRAELPPTVFAIAMSGYGMNADQRKSKAAGYRRHILKPFVPDDLDEILEEAAQEAAAE